MLGRLVRRCDARSRERGLGGDDQYLWGSTPTSFADSHSAS